MDPTTRNHSYTPTPTTDLHWLLEWTGLDWTALDWNGRLVVLKRSLCNHATSYRKEVGGPRAGGEVRYCILQSVAIMTISDYLVYSG